MHISIITAAFRPELMDRVKESIINQIHQDFEWVVVNDAQGGIRDWYRDFKASNCPLVAKTWFIDLERQKGRFGLYTRNIGAMAASDHIVFLDDDNEWTPNHLSSLVELEEKTGLIPYSYMRIIGKKEGSTVDHTKKTGLSRQGIDLGCLLYKKEYFEKYGYFRDDAQVTFDWNMIFRIMEGIGGQDKFVCTELPTLIFHHKRY